MFVPLIAKMFLAAAICAATGGILLLLLLGEMRHERKHAGANGRAPGFMSRRIRFRGVLIQKLLQFSCLAAAGSFFGALALRTLGKR
jgi:hypothetical protein